MSNPYRTNCAVPSTAASRANWCRRYLRARQLRTLERLRIRQELIADGLRGAWRNKSKQHRRYHVNPYKLSLWLKPALSIHTRRSLAGLCVVFVGLCLATSFAYVITGGLHGIRWFISL